MDLINKNLKWSSGSISYNQIHGQIHLTTTSYGDQKMRKNKDKPSYKKFNHLLA